MAEYFWLIIIALNNFMKYPSQIMPGFSESVVDFYRDRNVEPRFSGIYAQGIDRWLLVDGYDPWMTFETAKILSSKLPVLTFLLPNNIGSMTNQNCMNYYIFNKLHINTGRQTPTFTRIWDPAQINYLGVPEDFKNEQGLAMLEKLQAFANFVHVVVYAASWMDASSNVDNTQDIAERFLPDGWSDTMFSNVDRSQTKNGMATEIKKILYNSNTIEEADSAIYNLWLTQSADIPWQRNAYYKILGRDVPQALSNLPGTGKFTYFSV
jgi:hypothetical protein